MYSKLKALNKVIDTVGERIRPEMLIGVEDGIKKIYKNFKNKGTEPTESLVIMEITKDVEFVNTLKRVNITIDDIKDLAIKVFKNKESINVAQSNDNNKVGRNDKCPCGSGKKYKKCCMV